MSKPKRPRVRASLWLAGDHYLIARGGINDVGPLTFFVDTGGAHTGFTAPDATFTAAGIAIPPGGGPRLATIDRLSLGPTGHGDVAGTVGTFPSALETAFGFRLDGLITRRFFRNFALTLDFELMRVLLGHDDR